ncbi:MAG TPA: NUDIX domain-containing protein [Dehalococcoidia bacterium]|nr:NUDIX domain-containing protein [Dehalococcoidia bacterium]
MVPPGTTRLARDVAVVVVIFTVTDSQLRVILIRRSAEPFRDFLSLPGGLLNPGEGLEEAASRKLQDETGVRDVYLEQLYTFSNLDGRNTVAVTYFALVDSRQAQLARRDAWQPGWFPVYGLPPLAFANDQVIGYAVQRLQAKLEYTNVAYSLLPERFRLSDLQKVYEAILGRELDKRNFRRRMLSSGVIVPTGRLVTEGAHRPAQLYAFRERRPVVL